MLREVSCIRLKYNISFLLKKNIYIFLKKTIIFLFFGTWKIFLIGKTTFLCAEKKVHFALNSAPSMCYTNNNITMYTSRRLNQSRCTIIRTVFWIFRTLKDLLVSKLCLFSLFLSGDLFRVVEFVQKSTLLLGLY